MLLTKSPDLGLVRFHLFFDNFSDQIFEADETKD